MSGPTKPASDTGPTEATNPRVQNSVGQHTHSVGQTGPAQPTAPTGGGRVQCGKHATMPVLAADQYAEVVLPNLTML
eukprot:7381833-Prymnesium_polylepis.1